MKRLLHLWILTCFTLHCFASDFEMTAEQRGYVQTHADGSMTEKLSVPVGTTGEVTKVLKYQAQNNRTGDYSYGLALKVDHVPANSGTDLKIGQTVMIYYSAEEDQRVINIFDQNHKPIHDATQAKWGIAVEDFSIVQPLRGKTETAAVIKKTEPCSTVFDHQNSNTITQSVACLKNLNIDPTKKIPNPALAGINLSNTKVKPISVKPITAKPNDEALGEILTYMNNEVWDDIQHQKSFDASHFKDKKIRMEKRLAELERRKKINQQVFPLILDNAKLLGLSATTVTAIMHTESGFDPDKCSHAGACGLLQIILSTARQYADNPNLTKEQLQNIDTNIKIGTRIIADLLKKYNGNLKKALIAYNCGQGCINRTHLPKETVHYITKVTSSKAVMDSMIAEKNKLILASNTTARTIENTAAVSDVSADVEGSH